MGKILALVILYEIHDIDRFPTVQDFVSYARLVKCSKESAGKRLGFSGAKIGNACLCRARQTGPPQVGLLGGLGSLPTAQPPG